MPSKHTLDPKHIAYYSEFKRVCRVKDLFNNTRLEWIYEDSDEDLLFDQHNSWVYAITLNGLVVKIGETGHPLGIRQWDDGQPKKTTGCRMGRLRSGSGTDAYIREELHKHIKAGDLVEIWAQRCPKRNYYTQVGGQRFKTELTVHKRLEQQLIAHYLDLVGCNPLLNKSSK
jgi:hypothetical protein